MEAFAEDLAGSRRDRLLGLAVSPYLITTAMMVAALVLATKEGRDLPLWLVLVAVAAGWSAAWSP